MSDATSDVDVGGQYPEGVAGCRRLAEQGAIPFDPACFAPSAPPRLGAASG